MKQDPSEEETEAALRGLLIVMGVFLFILIVAIILAVLGMVFFPEETAALIALVAPGLELPVSLMK